MEYDPKQIVKKFEETTSNAANENLAHWWEQYDYNINRLKSILNSLKIDLAQSENWKSNPHRFWNDMRPFNLRLQQWLRGLHWLDNDKPLEQLTDNFISQIQPIIEELPAEIRILIGKVYWQISADDRLLIKIRKKLQPFRYKISSSRLGLINLVRRIRQNPPIKEVSDVRIIKLHSFLNMFLTYPVCTYFRDEWLNFLQTTLGRTFIVQGKIEELVEKMLLTEHIDTIFEQGNDNIFDTLYAMADILKDIDIALEAINDYEKQFIYRSKNFWQELEEKFCTAWQRAGTFQLPAKKYSDKEYEARWYKLENRLKRDIHLWEKQISGLTGDLQRDFDLANLGISSSINIFESAQTLNTDYQQKLQPELRSVTSQVGNLYKKVDTINDAKSLKTFYKTQLQDLSQSRFTQLLHIVSGAQIPNVINDSLEKINQYVDEVSKKIVLFLFRDTSGIPPKSRLKYVYLRDLIQISTFQECSITCAALRDTIILKQEDIFRNISQLGRMAEFQFESAVHLIEDEGPEEQIEEAKLIIRDTLSKATQQLSIISKEIDQTFELIKNELPADLKLFTTQLLKLMDRDNILNESVKLAKTRKKNIRKLWIGNFFKKLKNLIRGIVTFPWRYLKDIFKTYFLNAVTANPVKAPKSIQESVYKFLSETSDKISRLPYIYRKLFLFSPLTSARFYSAREKEVTALKDEYQNWINGKPGMVALVGELGSGKTTLLNMAKQNIFQADSWYHIDAISNVYNESEVNNLLAHKLDLNQTDSFDTLIQSIKKRKKRSVCILENLNFLFPKSVTGLELLESLMGFMVQTQDKIFWIITCSSYSWQYLKKTVRVEKYFHQVISLDAFSNGTIKSIIMNRHRLSGYDLLFESNGNHLHDRKLKKIKNEDHRQNYLKEQYFHFLNTISSGNISVAMLYWLRSIQSIEDDKVILNSAIDFDYDFLDSLTESELFTLASIINYEKLTVTDHATIFKQSVEQSRLNLNQMCRYGLLQEFDNYYHVHPFLYRHLVELLKSKNILH